MTPFSLKIVTPDGLKYDGQVQELVVRSTTGDLGIMAGHINCVAPLGMGQAMLLIDGNKRYAACIGGMISVLDGKVTLVPTTFEWADEIDVDRSERSEERARAVLADKASNTTDIRLAEARLKRALVRQGVAERK
ncbi:MAG: ATP synthase F1 subunit epsilon [Oscillospiraceae bacterium]|nr:ATP synthase F1 subunit epsilon [Oscillospiraceae bacterium]